MDEVHWKEHGWVLLRGALTEEAVAQARAWIDEVEQWASDDGPGLHHWEQTDTGPALARSEDLIPNHDGLRELICTGLLPDLASTLLGEPALLFKEKVNYKQPGGAGFAPHQDAAAYRFADHHVSCMLPLDPATAASGCLEVAHGHLDGLMPTTPGGRIADDIAATLDWQAVEVEPGDLLWFDSYAPHRSHTNTTDRPRRALYLTYNAASDGDLRDRYYDDKKAEFDSSDGTFGGDKVRVSITDDFLGRPAERPL